MLTVEDLAGMRATIGATFDKPLVIERGSDAPDALGNLLTTWLVAGAGSCRLDPLSGPLEKTLGARWAAVGDWVVTLPVTADVRQNDRLQIGGRLFYVKGLPAGRSDELCLRAVCVEAL